MRLGTWLLLGFATAAAVVSAQVHTTFPFCECQQSPSAYSVSPGVISHLNGTYCFTVNVDVPAGCTSYCCTKADLKKFELNVNDACNAHNTVVKATVNGVPTKISPSFETPNNAPPGAKLLKLTQLGLDQQTADGAKICITLEAKKPGTAACSKLEDLCVPPADPAAGPCSVALFDSQNDCCPGATPVPPPKPSPAPSPSTPCTVCAYFNLLELLPGPPRFPWTITNDTCYNWAEGVANEVAAQAMAVGAKMTGDEAVIECTDTTIKVCGAFVSENDGALLQPWIQTQADIWLSWIVTKQGCPAYMFGYQAIVNVGGDGDPLNPPAGCLNATATQSCSPSDPAFPACTCNTQPQATPFGVFPIMAETASPRSSEVNLYCFITTVLNATNPNSPCGRTDTLRKAEIFADDKLRGKVRAIALRPNGSADFSFQAPSWGSLGENTLKATPLNWNKEESDGGLICMEVDKSVTLNQLCIVKGNTCWINFFDVSLSCCPLYAATLIPDEQSR